MYEALVGGEQRDDKNAELGTGEGHWIYAMPLVVFLHYYVFQDSPHKYEYRQHGVSATGQLRN